MKSKEAAVQEVIKTDLDPGPSLQQGHYVRDPTATNRKVSGSHWLNRGRGAKLSQGAQHREWGRLWALAVPVPWGRGLGRGVGVQSMLGQST